ncbi:MAG: GNAT family N-acetyltransferase [Spirochaetales bacterium]|nr:GNAT family N-acetyltransferase [Spirochaetales bacterium]
MTKCFNEFQITDEKNQTTPEAVKKLLSQSYWAADRALKTIKKSIENSLCISVFLDDELVGFVRVVTDHATFAWIADLIIHETHRGNGLGKRLMKMIGDHPDIPSSIQILATRDAHGLYEKYGFKKWEGMRK